MASTTTVRNRALFAEFAKVRTNREAHAFGLRAVRSAEVSAESLAKHPLDVAARAMQRQVGDTARDVARYARVMGGDWDGPVAAASWTELRRAIGRLYALLWAIEDELPEGERMGYARAVGSIFLETVKAVPEVIETVLEKAGDAAGAAGEGLGKLIWAFLKKSWPVLAVAGGIVVAAVYVSAKAGAAAPGVKVG